MTDALATVFGGTGFLGRATVRALHDAGWRVRVAARHPERAKDSMPPGTEMVQADIRQPDSVRAALEGSEAAVNAVSLYVEHWNLSFDDIHTRGAADLALAVRETGTSRLVHMSGIGTRDDSPSKYVRARARGDQAVREAFRQTTLLRPSVLFGRGDSFLSTLDSVTRLPLVPLFGKGDTRLQPVHVQDVAAAVVAALKNPEAPGGTFELGGASIHTYREVVEAVLRQRRRSRVLMPVPFSLWKMMVLPLAVLPNPPLTRDQLVLMQENNLADDQEPGFAELGITPSGLTDRLADSLP